MTIEEQLRQRIIDEYGSVRAFTIQKNLTYASVDSILRRGIKNATWTNVKRLCAALEISADGLAKEKIIKSEKNVTKEVKVEDLIANFIQQLTTTDNLTLDGQPVSNEDECLIISTLETSMEIRKNQKKLLKRK